MINVKKFVKLIVIFLGVFFAAFQANAVADQDINDAAALKGIKEARGVFLIDFNNAKKMAFYMEIIEGTHAGFVRQNVKPNMVLVFIGPTVQYLSTKPADELEMEYGKELQAIRESATRLQRLGVRMEVCAVATKVFGIDNSTVLPEMSLVADGFISLIGWQTQDYKLVPIF